MALENRMPKNPTMDQRIQPGFTLGQYIVLFLNRLTKFFQKMVM